MLTRTDLRAVPLFDGLSDEQLDALREAGEEVGVEPGDLLFREGEHADAWWVLLSGSLELSRHSGREEVGVGRMDVPGRWAGGFRAWDDNGVYLATGRGREPGRVLRVPADRRRAFAHTGFPIAAHHVAGRYRPARALEAPRRASEAPS